MIQLSGEMLRKRDPFDILPIIQVVIKQHVPPMIGASELLFFKRIRFRSIGSASDFKIRNTIYHAHNFNRIRFIGSSRKPKRQNIFSDGDSIHHE